MQAEERVKKEREDEKENRDKDSPERK